MIDPKSHLSALIRVPHGWIVGAMINAMMTDAMMVSYLGIVKKLLQYRFIVALCGRNSL
jgi:hypothetical protein